MIHQFVDCNDAVYEGQIQSFTLHPLRQQNDPELGYNTSEKTIIVVVT